MNKAVERDLAELTVHSDPRVRLLAERILEALAASERPSGGRGTELLMPHGGYENLKAYKASEVVYDATVAFCDRLIDRRSRTHDQMVQAARSGKQNLVEGSAAAGTSSKTELRLVGVARASLEELLVDVEDFLRQRGLPKWNKDDSRAREVRKLAYERNRSYRTYRTYVEEQSPEIAANTLLCIINQTTYLIDRLKQQLEEAFLEHGGIAERMTEARLRRRAEARA